MIAVFNLVAMIRRPLIGFAWPRRFCLIFTCCGCAEEYLTGIKWEEPPIVKPGAANSDPPRMPWFLFDGKDLSQW